jgi:hypothetical protein
MGYTQLDGEITLHPDGTFIAHRFPASCINGQDERSFPTGGGYFELEGRWEVTEERGASSSALRLTFDHRELLEQMQVASGDKHLTARNSVEVSFLAGNPINLGFAIFNGDYFPLEYTRSPARPD